MSRIVIYKCDRCGNEKRDDPQHISFAGTIPVPTGHPSRTDCWGQRGVELCKECHESFQYWWVRDVCP